LTPIRTLSPFPASCYPTATAVYGIFDTLLQHHSKTYFISDRLSSTIRRGLAFFPPEALQPVLQPLMERMASCFDETGFACYLWIIGKVTSKFGEAAIGPGGDGLAGLLGGAFEKVTQVLGRRLGEKTAVEMPDGESFRSFSFHHPCSAPSICSLVTLPR
jgi:transportin-3